MPIIFEEIAIEPIADSAWASVHMRAVGIDTSAAGDFGGGQLAMRAAAEDEHSGDLIINLPDIGGGKLYLGASATDGGTTADSSAGGLVMRAAAFDLLPGQDAGGGDAMLRAYGLEQTPSVAVGLLVAQGPVLSAYGGLEFAVSRDALSFAAAMDRLPIPRIREAFQFGGAPSARYDGVARLEEALTLGAVPDWTVFALLRDVVLFGDDGVADSTAFVRVIERLLLTGEAGNLPEAIAVLTEALVLGTLLEQYRVGQAAETLLLSGHLESLYAAFVRIIDTVLLGSSAAPSYTAMVVVREALVLGADLSHEADLLALVRDSIGFAANLTIDNGEYIAWVMNTESKGLSRYTNYPFNSFAKIGGRYVGAASDGLHWLEGDDDNGEAIGARLRLGLHQLGDRRLKRIPDCFIGYTSSGVLLLKVVTVNERSGEREAAIYRLRPRAAANKRSNLFKLGRGLVAVDWDFEIENVDGAAFELPDVQFNVLRVDRRTRG